MTHRFTKPRKATSREQADVARRVFEVTGHLLELACQAPELSGVVRRIEQARGVAERIMTRSASNY